MCCNEGTTEYLALSICKIFRTGEGGGCSFDRVQKDYAAEMMHIQQILQRSVSNRICCSIFFRIPITLDIEPHFNQREKEMEA